uniref:Uncharacterized protein n=1 Tax=Anguilla anguilla TaxID=7936 RepID=A0A0E9T1Q8_ANGAN
MDIRLLICNQDCLTPPRAFLKLFIMKSCFTVCNLQG